MNDKNFDYLEKAVKNNQTSHLYLLNLQNQFNDDFVIFNIINILNENNNNNNIEFTNEIDFNNLYSNVFYLDGSFKSITKEEYQNTFYNMTFASSNKKKILIVKNVDNSSINALNSILKFIEEPVDDIFIVLTTKNLNLVLPTIKSRSQILNFNASDILTLEWINKIYGNNDFNPVLITLFKNNYHMLSKVMESKDKYIKIYSDIITLFIKSLTSKTSYFYKLFVLLDELLIKTEIEQNTFVVNLLLNLIMSTSSFIDLDNKYMKKIKDSNILVLEKNINLLKFIEEISSFLESLPIADFNLQKTILLIKLEGFYE
ncbi:hypothetical protein [Mycoplasma sp. CSL7503-lung]|uniref:hypothetical protein n=1 Tax=Mycoplasma sp. CSL7503-lung TaxID=536372 RepID=UPI0021D117CF|nr:hypothetical protein [Mycoplasma sp. CSL7503-lung]MCU4706670.1 hypothetical protein [Mycoplasma sp. CSL7503-lung]